MKGKTIRIITSLVLIITLITSLMMIRVTVSAKTIYNGKEGQYYWTIDDTGTLTIESSNIGLVDIPDYSLKTNPPYYKYRSYIKSINIDDSINKIGSYAFYNLTNAKTVTIGENVTSIHTAPFYHCTALTSFSVSKNNRSFCNSGPILCNKESTSIIAYPANRSASAYNFPDFITDVNGFAFAYAQNLISITQSGNNLKTINSEAFSYCSKLKTVNIENGCLSLGNKVFYESNNLTSVRIPPSVTSIGANLFSDKSKVSNLIVECDSPSTIYKYVTTNNYKQKTYGEWNFNVEFNPNKGKAAYTSGSYTYGIKYGNIPTAWRTGYSFQGWYVNNIRITKNTIMNIPNSFTANAKWIAKIYTIKLEPNGGLCDSDHINVTFDNRYKNLPIPTRYGYTFKGWYTNDKVVTNNSIYNNESINTLYAKWEKTDLTKNVTVNKVKKTKIKYKNKNAVTLSWAKQTNITGYEIWEKVNSKSYKKIATVTKNRKVIKKLKSKNKYIFKVRAYYKIGQQVKYGRFGGKVSRAKTYVKAPNLKAQFFPDDGVLQVKWKKISNADKYEIYRLKSGKWTKIKTTTSSAFFTYSNSNIISQFKVRAYTTVLKHKFFSKYSR